MIHFDVLYFSEGRSEEVISFFSCSMYNAVFFIKVWQSIIPACVPLYKNMDDNEGYSPIDRGYFRPRPRGSDRPIIEKGPIDRGSDRRMIKIKRIYT